MTHERDMERLLDHWFSDGPTEAPDRVIDVVADRIGRQRQRPAWRLDWRHATMTPTLKFGAAIAAVIIIGILGFGLFRGGDDSGVSPPAASPTSNPTVAPSLAPTPAPSATPSATVEAGVPGACDLMTADEAAQALHISYALEARSLIDLNIDDPAPFPSAICAYITGSTALVVLGYSKENGADTLAIWKRSTEGEAVSGLGDGALWAPAKTTLYVLKDDRLVTIEPLDPSMPPLTLETAKAIGAIVVARM